MVKSNYVTFLEAMKAYINDDFDVIFHGKENEIQVLFNAETSKLRLNEMTSVSGYTFFELTDGLWSIVK